MLCGVLGPDNTVDLSFISPRAHMRNEELL